MSVHEYLALAQVGVFLVLAALNGYLLLRTKQSADLRKEGAVDCPPKARRR